MIQIIASVLFVGFVLYKFFTNPRWWNLLTNSVAFVIVSILVATFAWHLGFPPSFVGYMVMILSGSGGLWIWVVTIFFAGAVIPLVLFGIGWFLHDMFYNEDDLERDVHQPIFIRTRGGWRINW